MEGGNCDPVHADPEKDNYRAVEIRWKGPKITLSSFRRTVKRNFTREEKAIDPNGIIQWDEEFHSICTLSGSKDNVFNPWEIGFTVLSVSFLISPFLFSLINIILFPTPFPASCFNFN